MPKLPTLTPKRLIRALKKTGFTLARTSGSHYVFFHPQTKAVVIVPYHNRDLPKGTLLEILDQAGISREELRKLL